MGWFLGFGIPLVYLFGVPLAYRILYIRSMTEYLRWKNEDPKKVAYTFCDRYRYDTIEKTRSQLSYSWYCHSNNQGRKSGGPKKAWLWPYLVIVSPMVTGVRTFCTPEVKIPDLPKISKLEELEKL